MLEHLRMLRDELSQQGGLRLNLYKPTSDHLALFQSAEQQKAYSPPRCTIKVEDVPDATSLRRYTFDELLPIVEKATDYIGPHAVDLTWRLLDREDLDIEQVFIDIQKCGRGVQSIVRRRAFVERAVSEEPDVADAGV